MFSANIQIIIIHNNKKMFFYKNLHFLNLLTVSVALFTI